MPSKDGEKQREKKKKTKKKKEEAQRKSKVCTEFAHQTREQLATSLKSAKNKAKKPSERTKRLSPCIYLFTCIHTHTHV